MLPTTNLDIVRRMRDDPLGGISEEARTYARTEYNGNAQWFLTQAVRSRQAGSARPSRRAPRRPFARLLAAIAARLARPEVP